MDVPLRHTLMFDENPGSNSVLILVVMDVPLRLWMLREKETTKCLNPCCNGCASQAERYLDELAKRYSVLILVVMDVPLRHLMRNLFIRKSNVLILVVMDVPLRRFFLHFSECQ